VFFRIEPTGDKKYIISTMKASDGNQSKTKAWELGEEFESSAGNQSIMHQRQQKFSMGGTAFVHPGSPLCSLLRVRKRNQGMPPNI
jgi:hypothetical protein